jgi:hypothetical protein
MDPISTFKGTRRVISLAWDVVAAHLEDAQLNFEKMSKLMSMLYPVYSGNNASSITTAPLLKLQFANLIHDSERQGLVGKVDGFNFTPVLEEQFFDPEVGILYPKSFNLSCNFTVLHTLPLGWDQNHKTRNKHFPYGENIEMDEENQDTKTNKEETVRGTVEAVAAQQNNLLGAKK